MKRIVVSDIWGRTDAFVRLAGRLKSGVLLTPYEDDSLAFADEGIAYAHFCASVGIEGYAAKIFAAISELAEQGGEDAKCDVIAFSTGAAAVWSLLDGEMSEHIGKAVLFYGSRIRDSLDLQPKVPVDVIMPLSEKSFDVQKVCDVLRQKALVTVTHCAYVHGFMNELSAGYESGGYEKFIAYTHAALEQHQPCGSCAY